MCDDFQFPLLGSKNYLYKHRNAEIITFNSLYWVPSMCKLCIVLLPYFQFPLLGSVIKMLSEKEIEELLSIPFIGFVRGQIPPQQIPPQPFNSLYWVLRLSNNFLGVKHFFQFPLLGSAPPMTLCTVKYCFFQFPLLGSVCSNKDKNELENVLSIPFIGFMFRLMSKGSVIYLFQFPLLGS